MENNKKYHDISERKILLRFIDIALLLLSIFLLNTYLDFEYISFSSQNITTWLILLVFYYLLFGEVFQLFDLNVSNNRYLVVRSILLTSLAVTIFYVFTPFISPSLPENRLQIVYFFLIISFPILLWRFVYMFLIFSPKYFKNIVFIGNSSKIQKILYQIKNDNIHHINAYVSNKEIKGLEGFKDIVTTNLFKLIDKNFITEVVVSIKDFPENITQKLNKDLILLFEKGVRIVSYETFYESVTLRVPVEYLGKDFYKNINFSKNNTNRFYLFGLRFVDVFVAIIGIISLLLISPFIIAGNLIGNRGNLFYSQIRVGQNGNHFKIYKLRSMVKNAEQNGAVWAQKNDTRITAFGKFLRNTRLDEVPQFFNILKGEMSIIGPRPERPEFVKDLEKKIPFYTIRNVVRPGLTGWAQVNYPYANTIEEQETKLRYDLYYIKERNAFLDFKILIKTATTILFFRGQ